MISLLGSLLNLKGLEETRYTLLGSQGPYELRLYQRTTLAKVSVPGIYSIQDAFSEGKRLLEEYLQGSNLRLEKVPHGQIYYQSSRQNDWDIGVMLNFLRVTSEIPRPVNRLVRLEEMPPCKMAVLRCNNISTSDVYYQREEELRRWISLKCYQEKGEARLIHLNSGLPLPFLKDKEISIHVT